MEKTLEEKIIERWCRKSGASARYEERIGARMSERQQAIAPHEEKLTESGRIEITVPHTRQR